MPFLTFHEAFYFYSMTRFLFLLFPFSLCAQVNQDSAAFYIKDLYREIYGEEKAYRWLTTLTKDIGARLSGTDNCTKAVAWAKSTMDTFGLDKVWLQPVMVPYWERGKPEHAVMYSHSIGTFPLNVLALGMSPGTGDAGVHAEVISVLTLDELRALPDEKVKGKIVFFNRPMDKSSLSTFSAYGQAGDQRSYGPALAAQKGAVAAIVRSLSTSHDNEPHTGWTSTPEDVEAIPSVAVSTIDADILTTALSLGKVDVQLHTYCQNLGERPSFSVIGELTGSEFPKEIILVGGHLDSWDVGEGAHDDGAGCVQSMEVIYRLAKRKYRPRHTVRCVLFMNEESGIRGGVEYARVAAENGEFHYAAIETDGGGGTAQGFGVSAGEGKNLDVMLAQMEPISSLIEPYDLEFRPGGGGADIGPLKPKAGLLIGLRPDSSRYFDFHHSRRDVLENVHPRELASGSAALVSLLYLLDQIGPQL